VRFKNEACTGTGTKNGTCYTSEECDVKGGTKEGSCADGFGVCCTFAIGCGKTSSENCTYFESTGSEAAGACTIKICPCSSGICQLRMDFSSFQITGPATVTDVIGKETDGKIIGAGKNAAITTACLTDTFSVTGGTGINTPPRICGTNTGEHMYVDSSERCNDLSFQLGSAANGVSAIATRKWSIKVTQYSCDYNNLAPDGCTQYFWGGTTGSVMSYNFDGGMHLADQNHLFCVRKERNYCRICWSVADAADLVLSRKTPEMKGKTGATNGCCGYGADGMKTTGYDCIVIPGAEKQADGAAVAATKQCGRTKGLVTADDGANATVCSKSTPFNLQFLSGFRN